MQDPALMERRKAEEKTLRAAVANTLDLKDCADAWDTKRKSQIQFS